MSANLLLQIFGSDKHILNGRFYDREEMPSLLARLGDTVRFGLSGPDNTRYQWLFVRGTPDAAEKLSAAFDAYAERARAGGGSPLPRWSDAIPLGSWLLFLWRLNRMHPANDIEQTNKKLSDFAQTAGLEPIKDSWRKDFRAPLEPKAESFLDGVQTSAAPREPQVLDLIDLSDYEEPIPMRPWHIDGVTMRGHVSAIAGRAGAGKSGLGLKLAVCCALGRSWDDFHVKYAANVLFLSVEDDTDEKHRRLAATCAGMKIDRIQLRGRLYSMEVRDLVLLTRDKDSGRPVESPLYEDLIATIKAKNIGLLFIDPLIEVHSGLDENSNTDMKEIAVALRSIARRCNIPVMFVHHTRKGAAVGDQDAARGGTAIVANVRNVLILDPLPKDLVSKVEPGTEFDHFMLTMAKSNYSRRGSQRFYKRISHSLGNGPNGGDTAADIVRVQFDEASAASWNRLDELLDRVETSDWKLSNNAKKDTRLIDLVQAFGEDIPMMNALLAEGWIVADVRRDASRNQTTFAKVARRRVGVVQSPTQSPRPTYADGRVGDLLDTYAAE